MKNIFRLSILIILVLFLDSCKKDNTLPPSAITISASDLSNTSARLNGTVNANYGSTSVSFEYGLTSSYGEIIQVQDPISGSTPETIASDITGLISGVTYHYRIKAVNGKGTTFGEDMQFTTLIVDDDGNTYNAVTIGSQTWMVENLKTTKFKDGITIPNITNSTEWKNLTTSAFSWYNNDPTTYKIIYGGLYNWYAVNTNKLCPDGWHVPSDAEWTNLTTHLGGEGVAGGKLKETGLLHWWDPNFGATNESGFTALPVGSRSIYGDFNECGKYATFWSSTNNSSTDAWYRSIYYASQVVLKLSTNSKEGYSIRCIRD